MRMVREHGPEHPSQWAAITSIASQFGCTADTLRNWARQAERDRGQRGGLTSDERQRLKELERDNRELKRANEILRKASAYFALAELEQRLHVSGFVQLLLEPQLVDLVNDDEQHLVVLGPIRHRRLEPQEFVDAETAVVGK
jgi:transposase-like protein